LYDHLLRASLAACQIIAVRAGYFFVHNVIIVFFIHSSIFKISKTNF
jgi:hypothetical protein